MATTTVRFMCKNHKFNLHSTFYIWIHFFFKSKRKKGPCSVILFVELFLPIIDGEEYVISIEDVGHVD
jgi:hypothetical protein